MKDFDVAIAGEVNLDLILRGLPVEMPVERELLATGFDATLGSSSAILAHNLSVLGARVGFITCAGDDDFGRSALRRLAEAGVDTSKALTHRGGLATGVTVVLPHGASRHMFTYLGATVALTVEDVDRAYLKRARHYHLSSPYLQRGLQAGLPELVRELREAGMTVSVDPNDDPEDKWGAPLDAILPLTDILLLNEREILRMTGAGSLEKALEALGSRVPVIAVKCGAHGSVVWARGERFDAGPVAVTPVDMIGAGDTYNAGFLYAWLNGCGWAGCARAGNITGALSTLRPGGTEAFRDRALVKEFLARHRFPVTSVLLGDK